MFMIRKIAVVALMIGTATAFKGTAVAGDKSTKDRAFASLPAPGALTVNKDRSEVILHARVAACLRRAPAHDINPTDACRTEYSSAINGTDARRCCPSRAAATYLWSV
jgi:hypothetical protein